MSLSLGAKYFLLKLTILIFFNYINYIQETNMVLQWGEQVFFCDKYFQNSLV